MLAACEATTLACIERTESRGSHARRDFPEASPCLAGINVVVRKAAGELAVTREAIQEMPDEMKRLVDWSKTWLTRKPVSESGAATPQAVNSRNTG